MHWELYTLQCNAINKKNSIPNDVNVDCTPITSILIYNNMLFRVKTAEHVCTVKLSNVYEKLGVGQKLEGDITDPATWEGQENQTKFVLGR